MENIVEVENISNEADETKAVLVVTSKVKKYIKATSGMNTAGDVADALTKTVIAEIQKATAKAKEAGRKTIMARDFSDAS